MAARGGPPLAVLALAGASLLHLAAAVPANGYHVGLPGFQAGLTLDLGWPGPSPPLLGGNNQPSGSGDRLQSSSNSFHFLPGFSFNFGGGDSSSGPSANEAVAAWSWPGAEAGFDGSLPPGAEADAVSRVADAVSRVAPVQDAVVGDPGIGDPSGAFAAWASVDAPLVGDLARGVAAGASSLLGGGLFGTPAPEDGVVFNLFTRKDLTPTRIFARDAANIRRSTSFDPRKKTKFVIHGFTSDNKPKSGGHLVKDAILKVADVNVILVDWSAVDPRFYPRDVSTAVPMVAATVAELVQALAAGAGADLNDVHIIGHSLGAHIAGAAGSVALGPAGKGWITGLDPAGPMFEGADPASRLDPSDAAFVEAIHTDAGKLGIVQPVAHVDFIVDGGQHPLPECGPDHLGLCSHCFAWEVYSFAVANPGAVLATQCGSAEEFQQGQCRGNQQTPLGLNPNRNSRGVFHVDSAEKPSEAMKAVGRGSISAFVISQINRQRKTSSSEQSSDEMIFRC